MTYFIKFIYSTFLLPPGIFVVALFLLCWKLYKKQRNTAKVLVVITSVFYLCTTSWVSNTLIRSLESQHSPPAQVGGDVIIMLGGGATLDTPNVHGQGHLSRAGANRLLTCLQLYHQLHVPIIVSGGRVLKTTGCEAEIAKTILMGLGIPEEKIIVENKSRNTMENAKYTKELLEKYNYHSPVLVTSAFHMQRAVRQFEKIGASVIPYPADYRTNISGNFALHQLMPSADALSQASSALKEYLGLLAITWY